MIVKNIVLIGGLLIAVQANCDVVNSFDSNKDVIEQSKGNYPETKRRSDVPLGAIQKAWDKKKGKVYHVRNDNGDAIKIIVREGMNSTVTLPRWEKIKLYSIGNEDVIKIIKAKANTLILEPVGNVGVDTNVSIIGEGHNYSLYVRVEGANSRNLPDLQVRVKALPPQGFHKNRQSEAAKNFSKEWLDKMQIHPKELDFKFAMSGDRDIMPDFVYSDGFNTWLHYGDNFQKKTMPIIMAVIDGVDTTANYVVVGNAVVVQNIGILTLKNGGKRACVYPSRLGRHSYA